MIRIITAADPNWVIGIDNNIPWHFKADFKRFKEVTMGSVLVMGRSTWESLPKPLPGRRMIVLTRNHPDTLTSKHPKDACTYVSSLDSAYKLGAEDARFNGDIWVAGGGEVYKLALDGRSEVQEIDLTIVPEVDSEAIKKATKVTRLHGTFLEGFRSVKEASANPEDSRITHRQYVR